MISSWKTTMAGLIAGIPLAIDALLQAYHAGVFTGKTGAQLIGAVGVVLFGLVSKDHDVTGGNRANTAETTTQINKRL